MGISELSRYPKAIVKVYVVVLVIGLLIGSSSGMTFDLDSGSDSAIYELAWPLAGIMFGAAWFGFGPIIALFVGGVYVGGLVKAYIAVGGTLFIGGGAVSSQLVSSTMEMARGTMEVLAFLYGAVAGMYIAMHYGEIFDFGTPIDDVAKKNIMRKITQSLAIAIVAVGLKAVGV